MADSVGQGSHRAFHKYTYRLPTPPRILVPPPAANEAPRLHVKDSIIEGADLEFLREMDLASIISTHTLLEWSYERRRQAQMILPWLYLGPLMAAKDRAWLQAAGITMVVAVRPQESSMKVPIQTAIDCGCEVFAVDAASYSILIGKLAETTKAINKHLIKYREHAKATGKPQLGKVLVFCESGNERSAAVVAAYLMDILDDFDYIKSMQVCQTQRFCVNFDDSIKNILRAYWDILLAKRSVAQSHGEGRGMLGGTNSSGQAFTGFSPDAQRSSAKPKRTARDLDDDVDMTDDVDPSDVLRFTDRDITPFTD